MSRGLSEDEAKAMIVRGFAEPISKELPDYFDTIFLENVSHELYTEAPKEIASLINEWLACSH